MRTIITTAAATTAVLVVKMTPYHEFIIRSIANV